jgi:Protein of unknown function (DUF3617)
MANSVRKAVGLVVLAIVSAASAQAQGVKPGLWEITSKMSGNAEMDKAMAEMQKQLAAMPPAQRKQMEAMMAQNGMQISANAGGSTVKVCFSKKMAEDLDMRYSDRSDCTHTRQPRLGNTIKFSFSCEGGKTTGQGEYKLLADAGWDGDMTITSIQNGKRETMQMKSNGRWLGASCGNLKPLDETPLGKPSGR